MGYGLITEFMPPAQRGRYMALFGVFSGVGVFATSAVGLLVIPWLGWRPMFLIGGIGTLWVWWERRKLPESPRWLERIGRLREAETVLQRIEKEASPTGNLPPFVVVPAVKPKWVPITVLFSRPVIRRTLLAIAVNVTGLFGSYALMGWMPTFFVKQGMTVAHSLSFNMAMMAGYAAGPVFCVFIADRIGRRWGLVAFGFGMCRSGCDLSVLASPALIILCGFLLVGVVAVFLILALGGTTELFPTEYRFRGGALAQLVGRLGLIASPFIVLTLLDWYGIGGVVGAIAAMYLVVSLLMAVAGIETNLRSLEALGPDTITKRAASALASPPPA